MKLFEIKEQATWNGFLTNYADAPTPFLQSWEWGEFQKSLGQAVLRLGLFTDETTSPGIVEPAAQALVIRKTLPIPTFCFWYAARGPVIHAAHAATRCAIVDAP